MASTTVGNILRPVCQFGILAVLAGLGSPEIVGQYALGVAVSAPILVLAELRRREPGATDIRITSLVLALVGIAAVGFLEHSVQDRIALLLVVLSEAVEWVADLYARERGGVSFCLHGILSIVALWVVFERTGHLGAGLLAVLIARLLILFCYDFRRVRRERLTGGQETGVARLSGIVPCCFIALMLGYRALGIFAAMAFLAPVATGMVQALGQVAAPKLKKLYDDGNLQDFRRKAAQLGAVGWMLGLCGVAGAIIAGQQILGGLLGAAYAERPALLLALSAVVGAQFVATLLGTALIAGQRGNERMPIEIASVAATALACVVLVPRAGLLGAAAAAGFGVLVQIVGQLVVLHTIPKRPRGPALLELLKEPLLY